MLKAPSSRALEAFHFESLTENMDWHIQVCGDVIIPSWSPMGWWGRVGGVRPPPPPSPRPPPLTGPQTSGPVWGWLWGGSEGGGKGFKLPDLRNLRSHVH